MNRATKRIIGIAAVICIAAVLIFTAILEGEETLINEAPSYAQAPAPVPTPSPTPASAPAHTPEPAAEPEPEPDPIIPEPPDPIAGMCIYERIGQLFIVRLPNAQRAERLITEYHIGGFILFRNHIHSGEQVQQLIAGLQESAAIPLFIAVDEEGGRVSRLGHISERTASAYLIGQRFTPEEVQELHYHTGNRLVYFGFNMNFAPVADIWTNPANTVIGDRAFGSEPELVSEMVSAAVKGLRQAGVLSVIKHFPGHGDTVEDSHYLMAFYHHHRERFNTVEAMPFISGINAGTDGVMMGHIATPYLTPENPNQPATFSSYLMRQVLREEMGFEGLIITDALDMRGLTNYFSHDEIVINAFISGADILLMPANPEQAIYAMIEAYRSGRVSGERINESVRRIMKTKNID